MLSIIVAVASNGVIGDRNSLIWHISEDLQNFKRLTTDHPVIMGRKTFESLGRPLPNRRNVVISRQEDLRIEGCEVVHSLAEGLALFSEDEEVFVIGGAQIYREALPKADFLYLTRIDHAYEGDTCFPDWDEQEWLLMESEAFLKGRDFPYAFRFERYIRTGEKPQM